MKTNYISVVHKALQMWVRKWYNQDINKYLEKELASYSIFPIWCMQLEDN